MCDPTVHLKIGSSHAIGLAVSLLNKHRPPDSSLATRDSRLATDLRHWEWRYLWQLCQPAESVRLQTNAGAIHKVAISADGKVMAAQTGADKIALWDLTTKRPVTALAGRASSGPLALSATGHRLAIGTRNARGEPTLEVWDVNGPALRTTFSQPTLVRSLAFSPDETLLATFGSTGNVAVVEWASNRTLTL